jgi:hypothetical protein
MSDGQDFVIELVLNSMYMNDENPNQPSHVTSDLIELNYTVIGTTTNMGSGFREGSGLRVECDEDQPRAALPRSSLSGA